MKQFLRNGKPPITAMILEETSKAAIEKIEFAIKEGAEAFGIGLEQLQAEERTSNKIRAIINSCKGLPVYITSYRIKNNSGLSDEECVKLLKLGAECGADICDVMGDLYCATQWELTEDADAVEKQKQLVRELHAMGCQVIISTHIHDFFYEEQIMHIAKEQISRGADICKIVSFAQDEEQLFEDVKIMQRLKKELDKPFLFLANGQYSRLIRQMGTLFGSCLVLCRTYENEEQPSIILAKHLRDNYCE